MPQNIDAVEALRTLALARGSKLQPVHLLLDDDMRADLAELNTMLADLEERKAAGEPVEDDAPASLADAAPKKLDQLIAETTKARDDLEAEARTKGVVLAVNFRRLPPQQYASVVEQAEADVRKTAADDAMVPQYVRLTNAIGRRLAPLCFASATTADGQDLGMGWQQLCDEVLTSADLDECEAHCITINRAGAAVDFHRASSGSQPTS